MANERISCAIKGNYISPEGAVELRSTGQPRAAVPTSVLPRGLILVRSLGVNDIFGFLLGDYVEAHEIRGARGLARTGDHPQDIFGLQDTAADQVLLGHDDHLLSRAGLAAAHGMDTPVEVHAVDDRFDMGKGVDRGGRTVLRNHAGGVAGFSEDGNGAHGEILGRVGDGLANGFGDGESAALAAAAARTEVGDVAFGFDYDARHDLNRLARILAAGGFSGEHDRVGAIKDGVGDVAGFGARGTRVFDHRLEHLGGGDDGLAPGGGATDHVLLYHRDFFGRHFDAEIAAGDHDSVGGFEDFFQMIDGLRLFEFGNDRDIALVRGDDSLDGRDIGGGADEGESDGIDSVPEAKLQVLAIFGSHGRNGEGDSG